MKCKSVLIVGSEGLPFVKTGGLADVVGTLPPQLKALGMDVRVMLPLHSSIKKKYIGQLEHICNFYIHMGWRTQYVGVETMTYEGITYYFIDNEYYFGGPVYKGGEAEIEQYCYFSRAVVDAMPAIGFVPDVIHLNDWQTAAIAMLIKTQYGNAPQGKVRCVLTIHNLIYQGRANMGLVKDLLNLSEAYTTSQYLEAYGDANLLKSGLVFSDKLSTVSPTYAEEIQNAYFGEGLDGVLNARSNDLVGILNGIDTKSFDPAADASIPFPYTYGTLGEKRKDKEALIAELGLTIDADTPVIGMVTRLTQQKGLDLVIRVLDEILQENVALVLLGSGDRDYEDFFRGAEYHYKGRMVSWLGYNDQVARRIYAGADFFLMPSRFEPCGISQMIALRYGTLPIVRETGGLADTVIPYNEYTGEGNGFTFTNYNAHDMLHVIRLALSVYGTPAMKRLIKNAMAEDNSFKTSAKEYQRLYQSAMG